MANRTVSVALRAEIGQYVAGMSQASAATMRVGESAKASQTQASKHFDMAGKAGLLMGGAIVAGLGAAVGRSMEFEKSMSAVAAATQATGSTLEDLRDAAMKAGADTKYSATEAADGITEMAKAGVSAKDIMGGGLTGALSLAAAGQIDVAEAAGIASTAMTQFSLSGKDLPHVADLLAAGAGKAMGSVDDLGMALNQAGLVAASSGLSIEETTGTLAAFASAGLLGADSGTAMKSMLQKLQAPSKEAAGVMSELGINMYDANGNMLGMAEMAGQLQTHMAGLTQEQRNNALATIFGSDAVRAANVLYKEGASGITDWTAKVNDSGYAAKQAAALQDNLAGDLEKLGGAADALLTKLGSGAQGPLRELTQMFTELVNGASSVLSVFSALPGPVGGALLVFGAVAALSGPLSSMFETVALKAMYFGDAAKTAATSTGTLRGGIAGLIGAINPLALGFSLAALAVGNYMQDSAEVDARMQSAADAGESFRSTLAQQKGALNEASLAAAEMTVKASGLADAFDKLGISSRQAASALAGNQQDFHRILADLEDMDKQAMFTNESWNQLFGTGTRMAMDAVSGKATENADAFRKAAGAAGDYFLIVGNVDAGGWGRQIEAQNALTTATAAATAQTEAASEAQRTLGETLAGFVDPLGEYTGLLDQKKEADRTAAEATAAGTQSSKDSWRDYVTDVKLSFSEYMKGLEDQVTAQANWQTNMLLLAGRVSSGTIAELAKMGPEGAPLVADLVNRSDAELDRFDDITAMRSQQATDAWGKQLTDAAPVLAAIGKTAGAGVVASLVAQLQAGTTTVGQIAAQYGVNLAGGINPVLTALGRSPVTIDKVIARNERYIGGYVGDGGKYEPKGIVHGGEFVLTKEQTAKAGVSNLYNYARSLDGYANGGYVTAADVPKPYSTAPYGAPISTAGDATMGREYNEVKAWVDANAAPAFIGGGVSGGNAANRALGQQIAAGMGLAGQFGAIDFVFSHESGWNNLAQNPTSTAYGIAQFLDSTWATVGGRKTSDPSLQIQYGLKYMNKYGGPNGAANFWKAHHWYANGGVIPEPVEGVGLHSGDRYSFAEHGPEMVVPMSRPTSREVSGGSGGTVVNVAPPSLEGLAITGRLAMDSDGFVTLVDGRIAKAFTAASTRARYNP
jgi:TP901 family phage tail tape measure protein